MFAFKAAHAAEELMKANEALTDLVLTLKTSFAKQPEKQDMVCSPSSFSYNQFSVLIKYG